ncbi:MAG: hypothetical protein KDC92_06190, partial [Bacteroidetes bacterium]|nr:hypothetical protein [Bacteroidota bacterium]
TAFTFDPSVAHEFSTDRGTRLSIKPNSFITKNNGDVTLYIDEILDLSDMVIFNLSTTSKGALLETGGMLKITAVQGNDTLSNKLLKNINITVPTKDFKPDMRIWNGREHKNGFVDWHLQQNDEIGLEGDASGNLDDQTLLNGSDYFWRTRYYTLFQRIFKRRWMLADIAANNANVDSINNHNYQENLKELFALGVSENDTLLPNDTGAVASANATAQFGSYLFAAKNIGYLNIDRMSKLNQDQQGPVAVETDDKAANFQLIIKHNKTGFGAEMVNNKPMFKGVPYGSSIYVVGLSTKTGKPRLYLEEFKMNEKLGKVTTQFEEVALEDLKEKLSVLDS